ncbi:hypothetical protein LTR08_008107 [Meristemomyces frigidus]|nr:hypothetical protein LTR08_008107 [Meristemomyces frigidus]
MRIATLQYSPTLGSVSQNILRANALLAATPLPERLDLLVLPELAFTGYNFPSLEAITPFLEPTAAGPSTQWAIATATRLNCTVIVGYPERSQTPAATTAPDSTTDTAEPHPPSPKNYNSIVTIAPSGQVLANYRKSFLYYTDETWASEGQPHLSPPFFCAPLGSLCDGAAVGQGICMDINPRRFTAPWHAYEFAHAMLAGRARLVVLSMAWLTRLLPDELAMEPGRPDMETVAYWLERFNPLVAGLRAGEGEVIVVFANRCGIEGDVTGGVEVRGEVDGIVTGLVGMGDRACYAGSSCVMRFQRGSVRMYERGPDEVAILGKGEEGCLVVDTEMPARFLLSHKTG